MRSKVEITMDSISENESFARIAVAGFIASLNPTINELNNIKTAVSEAITNAIIHGYDNCYGKIILTCKIINNSIVIKIQDNGLGIDNIEKAMQPLYTSKPEMDRSGIGFTVMKSFMDRVFVYSKINCGTSIIMVKKLTVS
jgi:stage II sporulation protein AB (anti-sigma F factor)